MLVTVNPMPEGGGDASGSTGLIGLALLSGAVALQALVARRKREAEKRKRSPVRVGLLGTGWALKVQLPRFRAAGMEVVAIYSRSQSRAEALAKEHKIKHAFSDYKALCLCPEEMTIFALQSGKHVLCDKPTAFNLEEAERMEKAASASSKLCLIDHELRFTPAVLRMRNLIAEGTIGKVRFVTWNYCSSRPNSTLKWNWWCDKAQGGGLLGALGSHCFDLLRFVLREDFTSVSADLRNFSLRAPDETGEEKPVTSDFFFQALFRMTGDIPVSLIASCVTQGDVKTHHLLIAGERGSIVYDPRTGEMTCTDAERRVIAHTKAIAENPFPYGTSLMAVALQEAFGPKKDLAAVAVAANIVDGVKVQAVIDACRASSQAGGEWKKIQR